MHFQTNLIQRIEATDAKMKMTMTALFVLIEAMDGVDSAGKWAGNEKTTNEAATRRQQTTRKLKLPKVDRESKCKLITESWKGCILFCRTTQKMTRFCSNLKANLRMISSLISVCFVWLEPSPLLAMHLNTAWFMLGTKYSLMSMARWPSEARPSTRVLLLSSGASSRLMMEGGSTSWPTHATDTAWETFSRGRWSSGKARS